MKDRELERRLRAVGEPAPPPSLRARLQSGIPEFVGQSEPWRGRGRWTMATVGSAVGAVVVIMAAIGGALIFAPGTVTVAVSRDELIVHALSDEAAAAVESGAMQERVASLEEGN